MYGAYMLFAVAPLPPTALLGLVVELEEGASRTGNCRLTDVVGGLIATVAVVLVAIFWKQFGGLARR